ncbi:MAG: lipid II flippase MurJ [Chitinophagaceae bacterium]
MIGQKFNIASSLRALTLGMAFFQLMKAVLSVIVVMLSASLFGATIERDAWVIGWSLQVIVFKFLFGPVNEVFRAKFAQIRAEKSEQEAINAGFSLLLFFSIISILVVLLISFFSMEMVQLFAPGYSQYTDKLLIAKMIQLIIPTLLLSELIILFVALLNSYQSFYLPEIFGLVSLALNIVLLSAFARFWGIYTLVIANYLSAIILCILLIWYIRKYKLYPKSFSFSFRALLPFIIFGLPLYLSYSAGQVNSWSERVFVTYLGTGNSAALDYARKFIDMAVIVIFAIGNTTMPPILAEIWNREQNSLLYKKEFFLFLRMAILIISPVVLILSLCPQELIRVLLQHGHFAPQWVNPTAATLFWFGLGLFGVVFYVIAGQALLVQKKSYLYAAIGVSAQLLPILINWLFYQKAGLEIFGFSWCVAQYCCGLIMFLCTKSYNILEIKGTFKIAAIILISFFITILAKNFVLVTGNDILILVCLGMIYSICLLGLALLFNIEEVKFLKKRILLKK